MDTSIHKQNNLARQQAASDLHKMIQEFKKISPWQAQRICQFGKTRE